MTQTPLTIEQCSDPAEVRNRLDEITDRYFFSFVDSQTVAAYNALWYEIVKPLLDHIGELEYRLKGLEK